MSSENRVRQAIEDYYAVARPTWSSPEMEAGLRRLQALAVKVPDDSKQLAEERDRRIAEFDRLHPEKAAEIKALLARGRR